jgi:hypothetical protein
MRRRNRRDHIGRRPVYLFGAYERFLVVWPVDILECLQALADLGQQSTRGPMVRAQKRCIQGGEKLTGSTKRESP